jgi:hydroxymethylglutaryl-CoA reductase
MQDSRIPGLYKLSMAERRGVIADRAGLDLEALARSVATGGLDPATADQLVENVIGTYALPFGVALNFCVNGTDRLIPMVVEEPSVIAAASNAARMVRATGGFRAEPVESLMIGQVEIYDVPDPSVAVTRLKAARDELIARATAAAPGLVPFGGGPREIQIRDLGHGVIVLHVLVDCRDAMGANMVNTIAEAVAPRAAEIASGKPGLRILSNLCDRRRVRVTAEVEASELAIGDRFSSPEVIDGVVRASRFAELDVYRAATHNKGIMNGIDPVVIATGNDWRAVEAGAHAYAARSGQYAPLSTWRREGDRLIGTLELPLALGIVGGTLRAHPGARLALQLLGAQSAEDLSSTVAAVGLASNLAALRALATEGIQRGHMALHARSVTVGLGAAGEAGGK